MTKGICNAPYVPWPAVDCGNNDEDCVIGVNTYRDRDNNLITPKYKKYTKTNTFSVTIQDVTYVPGIEVITWLLDLNAGI